MCIQFSTRAKHTQNSWAQPDNHTYDEGILQNKMLLHAAGRDTLSVLRINFHCSSSKGKTKFSVSVLLICTRVISSRANLIFTHIHHGKMIPQGWPTWFGFTLHPNQLIE